MGEEWRTRAGADGRGVENKSESWWDRSGERERELMGEEWRTRARAGERGVENESES